MPAGAGLRCLALVASGAVAAGLELKRAAGALQSSEAIDHPWPTSRGPQLRQFGQTDVVVPRNFSTSLRWKWQHPDGRYRTSVGGGPVIDAGGNLYLTTNDGVRKFSPEGQVLWHFEQHNHRINNEVSLFGDKVYGSNQDGGAFALYTESGEPAWLKKLAGDAGGDAGYPVAHDGVFVMGADQGHHPTMTGGSRLVFGLDASTGETLWQFEPQFPVWNFAPLFPGDGTTVFMDFTGGMYRLGLHNGTRLWHSPVTGASYSFSDGGATLGPNGAVYSCSNPGADSGKEGSHGLVRALRVANGATMWERTLPQACNSYPAVGTVQGGQRLSVVVTPGSFMGQPKLHGSVMAFDAATGETQWRYNAPLFTGKMNLAKGDPEGLNERRKVSLEHIMCMPAHWSSANIAGDGAVFAGRSDGLIYSVRGGSAMTPASAEVSLAASGGGQASGAEEMNADFASTPGLDVQTWDADGAPLHGAFAFAPGVMAFASCDTLYYFKF